MKKFLSYVRIVNYKYKILFTDTVGTDGGSVGELSVQVDLFTHPGTGEQKVTIKGSLGFSIHSFVFFNLKYEIKQFN